MGGTSHNSLRKMHGTNRSAPEMGNGENTHAGWTGGALTGAAGEPPPARRRDVVRRFVRKRGGFFESAGTHVSGHSEDSTFTSYPSSISCCTFHLLGFITTAAQSLSPLQGNLRTYAVHCATFCIAPITAVSIGTKRLTVTGHSLHLRGAPCDVTVRQGDGSRPRSVDAAPLQ